MTPTALFMSLLVFIRANEESATKARRIRAVWDAKRAKAADKAMTARGPAWLQLVDGRWGIIEERAEVVRRIFELAHQGLGQHGIAELLNQEQVPVFGRGAHWHRSYVAKILESPSVIGTLVPHALEYIDGKRVRKPQATVEGYYPAVVEPEVFQAVSAMAETRAPLRGRHARGIIKNVFGGLARCHICSSTMTLANKGSGRKGGRPKLVCTKAKSGAGCQYRTVDYGRVEAAMLFQTDRLIGEAPLGDASPELDEKIDGLQAAIFVTEDRLEQLLDDLASGTLPKTPAVAQRVRRTEEELELLRRELDDTVRKAATTRGPLVARRMSDLRSALTERPLDRKRANGLFRQLLLSVTVDHENLELVLHWQHGGESSIVYGMPPVPRDELVEDEELEDLARGTAASPPLAVSNGGVAGMPQLRGRRDDR